MVDFTAWLQNPAATRIVLVEVNVKSGGVETTRYLSTGPYVTSPTDPLPNQYYEPVLTSALQYTEQLDIAGTGGLSGGDLEIANYNGERDSWLMDIWDNRAIIAWIGDPSWARSDFQMIFNGIVATIDSKANTTLTLSLRDKLQRLNTPATDAKIGGTGTNKDDVLNLTFGEAHNVTPQLVDAAALKYKVHDSNIESIIEVRDNGVPVSVNIDTTTGTFTLNQQSIGTVTCSVQGDKNPTYVNTIANIVQRLATGYGTATSRYSLSDIDTSNFASFNTACPQPVGTYIEGSSNNVLTTCQDLAKSVDARLVTSRAGLLRLIQLQIPGAGVPVAIGAPQILKDSLKIVQRPLVQAAFTLGYDKNYTVQDNLVTNIPDEHKKMFAEEWLSVTVTNATVKADYKLNDAPPQTDTNLLTNSDANTEANRRVNIWSQPRTVFQFEGTADLIGSLTLGCAATLTHYRFGLSGGKTGIVTSLSPNWFKGTIIVEILV